MKPDEVVGQGRGLYRPSATSHLRWSIAPSSSKQEHNALTGAEDILCAAGHLMSSTPDRAISVLNFAVRTGSSLIAVVTTTLSAPGGVRSPNSIMASAEG